MIPALIPVDSLLASVDEADDRLWTTAQQLHHMAAHAGWQIGPGARELMETLLTAAASAEQQLSEQRERIRYLEDLSMTDELTGLLNRRGFKVELDRALARARRGGESGLLVLCDLNHFKAINDSYGHPAGDAVLMAVAHLLRHRTRRSDYVARLGGDEFAILMTGSDRNEAEALAGKLRDAVNDLVVRWEGVHIPVSASLGWQSYDPTSSAETLVFLADQALYRAKGGKARCRNRSS